VQPAGTNSGRTQVTDGSEYRIKFRQIPEAPAPAP